MNNFLAISGSKETIDRVAESIVRKGVQNFVIDVQVDIDKLSDDYSFVANKQIAKVGSLITFERKNDSEININISSMGGCHGATIGVALGIASKIDNIRVAHRFYKKNKPFLGGYIIANRKLDGFYCWQSNREICNAVTTYLIQEKLTLEDHGYPSYIEFLSREQRAGICHDYFEDSYGVKIEDCGRFYLRVSREDADGDSLDIESVSEASLVIGDVVWSASEGSVIEGMLDEFTDVSPSKFYHNHVPMKFSETYYQQVKCANSWSS